MSLAVVGNGFARARLPSGSTPLPFAAELAQAEAAARAAGRGAWAKGDAPRHKINDMTRDTAKAKAFLPFLQRGGRTRAQVEFVISGGRLKLLLDRDGAVILFSLNGVRCPRAPDSGAAEALAFQRTHLTHRTVEVEVDSLEPRAGVFLGALYVPPPGSAATAPKASLALLLVQAGLAYVVSSADARPDARQLRAAEAAARAARAGLWKDYVEPEAPAAVVASHEPAAVLAVTVTDVVNGGTVYLQMRDEPELARMQAALADVAEVEAFKPAPGVLCCGRFTGDDVWYRAFVVSARDDSYSVFFCDFGNSETLPASRLAPLQPELAAVPPLAHLALLAHVRVPTLEEECGLEAARLLAHLTGGGRKLQARVETRTAPTGKRHAPCSAPTMTVSMRDPEDGELSLSAHMLRAGLARLTAKGKAADALQPQVDEARAARRGLFELGDPDSDDEDDKGRGAGARGRAR